MWKLNDMISFDMTDSECMECKDVIRYNGQLNSRKYLGFDLIGIWAAGSDLLFDADSETPHMT